jgi:hypothetical protein
MVKTVESTGLGARSELRAWYLDRLRPRLERAVADGEVEPGSLEALDLQFGQFLEPPRRPVVGAA